MAINYIKVGPFNNLGTPALNKLNLDKWDNAIKNACDGVDNINSGLVNYASASNVDIAYRNIIKLMLKNSGINAGVNAWSDDISDISGVNASLSSGYLLRNGAFILSNSIDLCTGGTPISGGDNSSYPKSGAFDDNASSKWGSSQGYGSINGVAYIGYDFGATNSYHVRKFTLNQDTTTTAVSSVKVQRSTDGSAWTDVATVAVTKGAGAYSYDVPASVASRYWRLLANSDITSGYNGWYIVELDFQEMNTSATIVWNAQSATGQLTKGIVEAIQNLGAGTITYYLSRDNGATFTACLYDTPTNISAQPAGTSIVCKVVITGNAQLLAIGYGGEL